MEIVMAYETLFDILRKEKSREELQELPEEFYGLVAAFVTEKAKEIDKAGGAFAPSAQKLLIQQRNVHKILKELYERRERKILHMALNRARTESNLIDTSTLLPQEKLLYEQAANLLKQEKSQLLFPLLQNQVPAGITPVTAPIPEQKEKPVSSQKPTSEHCDVRFLASVPKFLGLNGQVHGPFEPGDETTLPGKIAEVLLRKNRVELA